MARVGFEGALSAHGDALPYFDLKRIELARALACAPDLLLLDEWLAGLNPTELEAGIALVRSLAEDGMTILMVEHVMHAIRSLCGHIVVLDAGRVIAVGTPEEALARPGCDAGLSWARVRSSDGQPAVQPKAGCCASSAFRLCGYV